MRNETEKKPALIVFLVNRVSNGNDNLLFGQDMSFLTDWYSRLSNSQRVETHVTLENADESIFVMSCCYNLN